MLSPGLGDCSDHGNRLPGEKGSRGFPDELARLPIASFPLTSSFILGKLLTHSESQLVLFLNGDNDAYLRDRVVAGFRNHIYVHIYI